MPGSKCWSSRQTGTATGARPARSEMPEIVDNCDRVIAFWDGESRGTLNTVVRALDAGLPVTVCGSDGTELPLDAVVECAEKTGVTEALRRALICI